MIGSVFTVSGKSLFPVVTGTFCRQGLRGSLCCARGLRAQMGTAQIELRRDHTRAVNLKTRLAQQWGIGIDGT